ncbi:MAG: hypothetical protein IKP40_06260 [Clostridia bacterium]|nr:hypothetical protein [Clostridia bacterium]
MTDQKQDTIDRLLEAPCWVIDFLPRRVPPHSEGQFFAVEKYFSSAPRLEAFRLKLADVLLKLSCYFDFEVIPGGEEAFRNPPPDTLAGWIANPRRTLLILLNSAQSLITLYPGDLCAAVHQPTGELLALLRPLAAANGLFVWRAE